MSTEKITPANDLGDSFITRYADKCADPDEVLLRADFARAEQLRRDAVHAETEEQSNLLLGRARGLDARWRDRQDELSEAWWYLNDAVHDWKLEPQYMREYHDQIRLDDAASGHGGLSNAQWRSQLQARELTGHGTWPESLSWKRDDPFIARYADKVNDPGEVLVRADFARMHELETRTDYGQMSEQELDQLLDRTSEISRRWQSRDDHTGDTWRYLEDAVADWRRAPDTMRRFHEQIQIDRASGFEAISPDQWRSQLQARELTGHGTWEHEPIPGHAFAGLINGRDQDKEMDR